MPRINSGEVRAKKFQPEVIDAPNVKANRRAKEQARTASSEQELSAFDVPKPKVPVMSTELAVVTTPEKPEVWVKTNPGAEPKQAKSRGIFGRIFDGARRIVGGVRDAVVGSVRGVIERTVQTVQGVGNILQGNFRDGFRQLGEVVARSIRAPINSLITIGASALSGVQQVLGVEPRGEKLSRSQIAMLREVYGDAIDYSKVTIKEGSSGLITRGTGGAAITLGNTIYIPKEQLPLTDELLVHEMAHVWQFQNGGTDYLSAAFQAQKVGDGYEFADAIINKRLPFNRLNPEQQAHVLEEAKAQGCFENPPKPFFIEGQDFTWYLQDALRQVRRGRGAI